MKNKNKFLEYIKVFKDHPLPVEARLAGYSALIRIYQLDVPTPDTLYAIGKKHKKIRKDNWHILSPRYFPSPDLKGQLTFALKYEGLNLALLKRLFIKVNSLKIEEIVRKNPTGNYARRVWFLYEWLIGKKLDLQNAEIGNYVPVVDPDLQYCVKGKNSPRHRVRNNLPGNTQFCPMVYKTEKIEKFISLNLSEKVSDIMADVPIDLIARTASFLLLADSRASFTIEGEMPPENRIQRWAKVIGEAGKNKLDGDELKRLQKIVIGDTRFVKEGFRDKGGFVGEHDRRSHRPLPEHISSRAKDIPSLIKGLISFNNTEAKKIDPVISAAVLAFGFVYIHPFEDGNGRIHRYLIHHVLAKNGFSPPGMVFPISATILEKIENYREILQSYSKRLLEVIDWKSTDKGNVKVLNETDDFYRFFDCTLHVEFLYECVKETIDKVLPREINFLKNYDRFYEQINRIVDMPDSTINLLFHFLNQNNGELSKRAREKEFSKLKAKEVNMIEDIYKDIF
ncbi:MAG: Fic family protein [Elusimicrobiota bacterium]